MEKLRSYLNSLSTQEQEKFASGCSTTISYMRNAISSGKKMGVELCISIERKSNHAVRCEDLRPDVDWGYLRGTARDQS